MSENLGGRIAANFRQANIAESLAALMLRSFAAVAPVPREEDFGIDHVVTLMRRAGKVYSAENSFFVQVKTISSANFRVAGIGIQWLRDMELPYFPVVADLKNGSLSLFTVNTHRLAFLQNSRLKVLNFSIDGDGVDDFPLGDPLMTWTLDEISHAEFPEWAYSVLKPTLEVESWNQRYMRAQSVRRLDFKTQLFRDRKANGQATSPPVAGEIRHIPFGDASFIRTSVLRILEPFASLVANTPDYMHLGPELLLIRDAFRRLGIDPDFDNTWESIVAEMKDYAPEQSVPPNTTES